MTNDNLLIDLHHVSRHFGKQQALKDVSLQLLPGRIGLLGPNPGRIGLLGPNGAGKSTLLKLLLGLLPPSAGTGRVFGHPLGPPEGAGALRRPAAAFRAFAGDLLGAGATLRRTVGYMPEADALVPGLRGAEYVALAGELYGMPRRQALRRAHEVLTCLDLGDARYRRLEEYSTGMKQRLKLAQALVHDPPVLLLDEPTSGMDPAGRDGMLRLLGNLGAEHGKTILLSTHLLGDVESVCETIVILHQGRVLAQGGVAALCRRRHDRYRLQIQGEPQAYLEELRLEGVQLLQDNGRGELRVRVPPGWSTRAFFVLAAHSGVLVRGLRQDDEDLEDLFHRVIAQGGPGAPAPARDGPVLPPA